MRNGSGDRSYSITAQLSKRFPNGTELSGAYTYTDAKDRMSMGRDLPRFNTRSSPVDGSLEDRELRTSFWERPHKVTLVATTDLPLGLRLGLTYFGISGGAYTYVMLGDPNADGFISVLGPVGTTSYTCRRTPTTSAFPTLPTMQRSTGSFGTSPAFAITEGGSWSGTAAAIPGCTRPRPACRSGFASRTGARSKSPPTSSTC